MVPSLSRPSVAVASKKRQKKTCDDLAREIVHARGICEAHGFDDIECAGRLEWAHVCSRSYMQVRWDLRECGMTDGATCLCNKHHFHFTNHPIAERRFHTALLGPAAVAELELRAEQMMGTFIDYGAIIERLKAVA